MVRGSFSKCCSLLSFLLGAPPMHGNFQRKNIDHKSSTLDPKPQTLRPKS